MGAHWTMHPYVLGLRQSDFVGYLLIPTCAMFAWLGTLMMLFYDWTITDNARQYRKNSAWVAYISDAGAVHKLHFIVGASCTAFFFSLSLLVERRLRLSDRIPGPRSYYTALFDLLAVLFGVLGAALLVLVSAFDAVRHGSVHWALAFGFVCAICCSGVAQTGEIWMLRLDHPDRAHLRHNAKLKIGLVGCAVVLAIAFAGFYAGCGGRVDGPPGEDDGCWAITSTAATLEWIIGVGFALWCGTFVIDMWPAKEESDRWRRRMERRRRRAEGLPLLLGDGATPATTPGITPGLGTGGNVYGTFGRDDSNA